MSPPISLLNRAPKQPDHPRKKLFRRLIVAGNVILILLSVIIIAVGLYIYKQQKDEVWNFAKPYVNPPVVVVAICAIILLVSLTLGIAVIVKKTDWRLLHLYSTVLLILFIATIVVASVTIAALGSENNVEVFDDQFRAGLSGYDDYAELRKLMDDVQENLHCCGMNGFDDWNRNRNCTDTGDEVLVKRLRCYVPESCCSRKDVKCTYIITPGGNLSSKIGPYKMGCVQAVKDKIKMYARIMGGILFLDVVFIAASAVVCLLFLHWNPEQENRLKSNVGETENEERINLNYLSI